MERLTEQLSDAPDQVRRARTLVDRFVGGGLQQEQSATVAVLTSEVVTNALRHGRAPFHLLATCVDGILRVEVRDAGIDGRPVRRSPASDDVGGRGLLLVDSLADSWGWHPEDDGLVVWFELRV